LTKEICQPAGHIAGDCEETELANLLSFVSVGERDQAGAGLRGQSPVFADQQAVFSPDRNDDGREPSLGKKRQTYK
jgi:hypothetical protein